MTSRETVGLGRLVLPTDSIKISGLFGNQFESAACGTSVVVAGKRGRKLRHDDSNGTRAFPCLRRSGFSINWHRRRRCVRRVPANSPWKTVIIEIHVVSLSLRRRVALLNMHVERGRRNWRDRLSEICLKYSRATFSLMRKLN